MHSVPPARRRREPNRRDQWSKAVQRTRKLPASTRLFLVATLASHMDASGTVCYPRKRMALEAGISERQVTNYMTAAREAGWLVTLRPGYRSRTAEYRATFPNEKREVMSSLIHGSESGNSTTPLSAGNILPSFHAQGCEKAGSHEFPPLVPIGTTSASAYAHGSVRTAGRRTDSQRQEMRSPLCAFDSRKSRGGKTDDRFAAFGLGGLK